MVDTPSSKPSIIAQLLSGSLWVMGSHVAVLGFVFFAQRIILTQLTPEQNGTLFLERRLTELFVGLIADFGMNGLVLRRASQDRERLVEIVSSALWFRLILWALTTVAALGYVLSIGGPVIDVAMWSLFMLIASRTTLIRYTLEIQHRAHSRFMLPSLVAILDGALFFLGIWWFRESCTPTNVIAIFLISAIPGFVIIAAIGGGRALLPSHARMHEMRAIALQSLPLILYVVLWGFQDKIDAAILEMFAARADVGVLGAAYTSLGPLVAFLPQTLAMVVLPEIARQMKLEQNKAFEIISGLLRLTLVITTAMAVVAILVLPMYMEFVSGGRYTGFAYVFEAFLWTAPCVGIMACSQEVLVAMGLQKQTVRIAVVMVICTFLGGLALVPVYHVGGSIISKVVASLAGALAAAILVVRAMGHNVSLSFVVRVIIFVVSSVLAVKAAQWMIAQGYIYASLAAVLLGLGVIALATALRFINYHEWVLVRNVILRRGTQ